MTSPMAAPAPITRFADEYGFLSNFSFTPFETVDGIADSVEHGFQAAKTLDTALRRQILDAPSPSEAKRLGRRVQLRPDWESVKRPIMLELLRLKFEDQHRADQLLATGEARLIEGNHWGDREWGAVWDGRQWLGRNLLGELLMLVRDELRQVREMASQARFRGDVEGEVRLWATAGAVMVEVIEMGGAGGAVTLLPATARALGAQLCAWADEMAARRTRP